MVMNEQKNDWRSDLYKGFGQKIKSDSHETRKCVDAELQWQIRCFPYVEHSDVPSKSDKKPSDGRGISDYPLWYITYEGDLAVYTYKLFRNPVEEIGTGPTDRVR